MPYGTPTTDAELADYYRRTGLRPPSGHEPRFVTTPRTIQDVALPGSRVLGAIETFPVPPDSTTFTLVLPIPVSLNDCRCVVNGRIVTTAAGKRYQQHVITTYQATYGHRAPLDGSLCGTIELYPPDRRRRDLPNLEKLLGDALQTAGAYHDDSQFDEWHFYRRPKTEPGYIRLTITRKETP